MLKTKLPPLSNASLTAFASCQRRYMLQYLSELGWPLLPSGDAVASEEASQLGRWFHLAVEQRALGQDVTELLNQSPKLHAWWLGFLRNRFDKPKGQVRHEARLNFAYGGERILVVMDRLQRIDDSWRILDWKTGRRFERIELGDSWQTRLYRFALAHAGAVFNDGQSIAPEAITMAYWSAEHDTVERFPYDAATYTADARAIDAKIAELKDAQIKEFPATGIGIACHAKGRSCQFVPLCLDESTTGDDDIWEWPEETEATDDDEAPFR